MPSSYFVRKRSPAVPLHKSGGGRPGTYSSPLYTAAVPLLNCSCIIDSRVSELWASNERLGALSALSKSHFFAQQDWIMSSSVGYLMHLLGEKSFLSKDWSFLIEFSVLFLSKHKYNYTWYALNFIMLFWKMWKPTLDNWFYAIHNRKWDSVNDISASQKKTILLLQQWDSLL